MYVSTLAHVSLRQPFFDRDPETEDSIIFYHDMDH
jgi:hypothetical protein